MIIVYTGNGKGKTSACIGQAMRALGRDFAVGFGQFMKQPGCAGEQTVLARLLGDDFLAGGKGFLRREEDRPAHREAALATLDWARQRLERLDLLVLDEPVSGVDQKGLQLFLDTVLRLKEKHHMAILLVSHDLRYRACGNLFPEPRFLCGYRQRFRCGRHARKPERRHAGGFCPQDQAHPRRAAPPRGLPRPHRQPVFLRPLPWHGPRRGRVLGFLLGRGRTFLEKGEHPTVPSPFPKPAIRLALPSLPKLLALLNRC